MAYEFKYSALPIALCLCAVCTLHDPDKTENVMTEQNVIAQKEFFYLFAV